MEFNKIKILRNANAFYLVRTMLALVTYVIDGHMTIGMFIALISAVLGMAKHLSRRVNAMIQDLSYKRGYLKEITEVMKFDEQTESYREI